VMRLGEVRQFADPDTVYNRPANLFAARFMGAPPMNTLPACVEMSASGPMAVLGDASVRLALPELAGDAAAWCNRPVILGIRPECITAPVRADDGVTIEALVDMIEPTGAETIVLLRLAGHQVLARAAADFRPAPGSIARFTVDTARLCLFDPETERLIG